MWSHYYILMNRSLCFLQCLLVKGWKAGASWSFPRGKKNKDEEDHKCAIREVSFLWNLKWLLQTLVLSLWEFDFQFILLQTFESSKNGLLVRPH